MTKSETCGSLPTLLSDSITRGGEGRLDHVCTPPYTPVSGNSPVLGGEEVWQLAPCVQTTHWTQLTEHADTGKSSQLNTKYML